jgi:hypothetical protein
VTRAPARDRDDALGDRGNPDGDGKDAIFARVCDGAP